MTQIINTSQTSPGDDHPNAPSTGRQTPTPTDERLASPNTLFRAAAALDRPIQPTQPGAAARLRNDLVRWLPHGLEPTDIAIPSFAFADPAIPREPGTPATEQATVSPDVRFGHTLDGRHLVEVPIQTGTTLHGVGMQAAPLDRAGHAYTCWNLDWPAYDDKNPGLYQSHPLVYAVRADGTAFAIIADTTCRCDVDLRDPATVRFRAEGPAFPVHIIEAESPTGLSRAIAAYTGQTPMPPLWALGYQQCRWSYYPAGRAMRIAEQFRQRQIPCDVLWFDIHYMQDYRIFTFHDDRFPDPASLNERLHAMGFHTVWMIDPAPKKHDDDHVYSSGLAGDHFTLDSDGKPFVGSVWAGPSCFPDFTRRETREWWASLYREYMHHGIDGVWNDMNEPSVFDTKSKTMPETTWHRGDDQLPAAPHSVYHNVYGMLMVRASRDGILAAKTDKRPFVLTRSNFLGGHRYAATWTGDNAATWKDLALSIPMVLSMSLSGQLISGPDIGGFMDNTEGDPDLFARWMGIGCLLPFARAHVADGAIDKEPWSFGQDCEDTCRRAIETRYRLMPYFYTLAWRAHTAGLPLAAPLFYADPTDPALRAEDRAFLIGEDLIAECDVLPPGTQPQRPIARPNADWRPISLVQHDPNLPKLRLRAGAAIPVAPVAQHTAETRDAPITVFAAVTQDGTASGLLYEDEGDGFAFENGNFRLSRIAVDASQGEPRVELHHIDGDRPESGRPIELVLV